MKFTYSRAAKTLKAMLALGGENKMSQKTQKNDFFDKNGP